MRRGGESASGRFLRLLFELFRAESRSTRRRASRSVLTSDDPASFTPRAWFHPSRLEIPWRRGASRSTRCEYLPFCRDVRGGTQRFLHDEQRNTPCASHIPRPPPSPRGTPPSAPRAFRRSPNVLFAEGGGAGGSDDSGRSVGAPPGVGDASTDDWRRSNFCANFFALGGFDDDAGCGGGSFDFARLSKRAASSFALTMVRASPRRARAECVGERSVMLTWKTPRRNDVELDGEQVRQVPFSSTRPPPRRARAGPSFGLDTSLECEGSPAPRASSHRSRLFHASRATREPSGACRMAAAVRSR